MEQAGKLLGKIKLPKDAADPDIQIRAAWRAAAGKKIAERTRAAHMVRRILIVEVEDIIWQRQLNALKHFLLRNLNSILPDANVQDLDFRPTPKRMSAATAPSARRPSADTKEIADPFLAMLYRESENSHLKRTKKTAGAMPAARNSA